MNYDFHQWLQQNGLVELFTTNAGDSFYYNKDKGYGAIKTANPFNVQTFYLNDVMGFQTKDDEILVASWVQGSMFNTSPKGTRFSTNEVYMNVSFRSQMPIKLQIFRAGRGGNISRDKAEHWNLYNYACQLSQMVMSCVTGNI